MNSNLSRETSFSEMLSLDYDSQDAHADITPNTASDQNSIHARAYSQVSSEHSHESSAYTQVSDPQSLPDVSNHHGYLAIQDENTSLLNEVVTLTHTISNLNQCIEHMETEKQVSRTMYEQLLEKVNNLGAASNSSTTSDPIVTVYLQPDAHPPVNPSSIEDPEKLFFRESQWKASRNRNRGVLGADNEPTFPFLVNYEGNHATAEMISEMRQLARSVFTALRTFGHCPVSWLKADTFALTFFHRAMRAAFVEFRLCEYDWKANAFTIRVLPQWEGKPTKASIGIESEPGVKQEPAFEWTSSMPDATSTAKRPPSQTIPNTTTLLKKTRLDPGSN
ncbi:hypothetical protein BDN67DRAFT_1017768 [Paxillus ammoniavirescens]|nr:hypothetical protein BDN67DRAFT_1017768 [Paxillus ammoniavirescens]